MSDTTREFLFEYVFAFAQSEHYACDQEPNSTIIDFLLTSDGVGRKYFGNYLAAEAQKHIRIQFPWMYEVMHPYFVLHPLSKEDLEKWISDHKTIYGPTLRLKKVPEEEIIQWLISE